MGQPAYLEEDLLTNLITSFTEIVLGECHFHYSPRRNPLPINLMEDKLTRDPGLVGGPHSSNTSPALFCNPILGTDLVPALIPALVPARAPAPVLTDELFKQFMKAYLNSN